MSTTITVGSDPVSVAVNLTTTTVYVANESDNTVSVIDGLSNTVTHTIAVGGTPLGVAVNSTTNIVYVANYFDGTVSVIDGSTNAVTSTIAVSNPGAVAVDPTTNIVYVTNSDNTVSVIDGTTNTVTATITVGTGPVAVAVNSMTNTIYVTNYADSTVSVIDGSTNIVTATIAVGGVPSAVAVNSITNTVYVAILSDNTVSVIDGITNVVTHTIAVGFLPKGVAVDSATNTAYVANSNSSTLSVIDGSTNIVTATIAVGSFPSGVAVSPALHAIYVANSGDNTVSVVAGSGASSIQLVQSATFEQGYDPSVYNALPSDVTAGNTVIAVLSASGQVNGGSPAFTQVSNSPYDSTPQRWIRAVAQQVGSQCVEIWYLRGVAGGSLSVAVGAGETINSGDPVSITLMEFSGLWYVDPLQLTAGTNSNIYTLSSPAAKFANSASVMAQQTLRVGGCNWAPYGEASGSVSAVGSPFTLVSATGTGYGAAYNRNDGFVESNIADFSGTAPDGTPWASVIATFVPGRAGVATDLRFPEVLVQVNGAGVNSYATRTLDMDLSPWLNVAHYVRDMTIGPIGRQHELDRVQATQTSITVDNRTGQFNPWNTNSLLNAAWSGLVPEAPVTITTCYKGEFSSQFYGYLSSVTPSIQDALNTDVTLQYNDFLAMMALKNISGDLYAQAVLADAPSAYYRLGDSVGSINVIDSSGNDRNMLLVQGDSGFPIFGSTPAFLADSNTSLDLTAGTKQSNGGITNVNATVTPEVVVQPLNSSAWSFECWAKWTGNSNGTATAPYAFTASVSAASATPYPYFLYASSVVVPTLAQNAYVTGSGIPAETYLLVSVDYFGTGYEQLQLTNQATVANSTSVQSYPTSFTIMSAVNGSGQQFEIRLGATDDPNHILTPIDDTVYTGRVMVGPTQTTSLGQTVPSYVSPMAISQASDMLDGNFHHITVTFDGSTLSIYCDGNLSDATYLPGSFTFDYTNPVNVSIGAEISNPSPWSRPLPGRSSNGFAGNMQDVAFYQYTLTADQVKNHYDVAKYFSSVEVGAAEGGASAGRLNRVLATIGADPERFLRVPAPGQYRSGLSAETTPFKTLLYAETSSVTTTTALNYMQTISESEPGLIFQGGDGLLYALNRQYQYGLGVPDDVINVLSNAFPSDNSGQLFYDGPSLSIVQDDLDVWNDVQVQSSRQGSSLQEWGPTQDATARSSRAQYGPRTLQGLTSLQMQNDADALAIAQNYLRWYVEPITRVEQVTMSSVTAPPGGPAWQLQQMLGVLLYDSAKVFYQDQTPSTPFSGVYLIEQITHDVTITNGPEWKTTWALSPYEILMTGLELLDTRSAPATFGSDGNTSGQLTL